MFLGELKWMHFFQGLMFFFWYQIAKSWRKQEIVSLELHIAQQLLGENSWSLSNVNEGILALCLASFLLFLDYVTV